MDRNAAREKRGLKISPPFGTGVIASVPAQSESQFKPRADEVGVWRVFVYLPESVIGKNRHLGTDRVGQPSRCDLAVAVPKGMGPSIGLRANNLTLREGPNGPKNRKSSRGGKAHGHEVELPEQTELL